MEPLKSSFPSASKYQIYPKGVMWCLKKSFRTVKRKTCGQIIKTLCNCYLRLPDLTSHEKSFMAQTASVYGECPIGILQIGFRLSPAGTDEVNHKLYFGATSPFYVSITAFRFKSFFVPWRCWSKALRVFLRETSFRVPFDASYNSRTARICQGVFWKYN